MNSSNIKSNICWFKLKSDWKSQFWTAGWMREAVVGRSFKGLTHCRLYGLLTYTDSWLTASGNSLHPRKTPLADVMTFMASVRVFPHFRVRQRCHTPLLQFIRPSFVWHYKHKANYLLQAAPIFAHIVNIFIAFRQLSDRSHRPQFVNTV